MPASPSTARRALAALLATILTATVLSGDSVSGQNNAGLPPIVAESASILPSAHVAVLGDGLLGAPAIAPLRADACATSTNGPVEQAARRSPDTVVVVQNESCVGATLLSVGQSQVPQIDPGVDVVVLGGIGLEFDLPSLVAACLEPETRSATTCSEDAGLARATAANSFFSLRSLLQQIQRQAPNANIVLVAPPYPVSSNPLPLGSSCCNPSTDGNAQVRSVYDTARAVRNSVVESMADLALVLVETTDAFEGHRLDHADPWLTSGNQFHATPNQPGTEVIADLLEVLMPVATPAAGPPGAPAEIVLVLGTTNVDRESHEALADGAEFWINTHRLGDVNPSVAVLPVRTSAPPVTTTTTVSPAIADDSAPIELVDQEPLIGEPAPNQVEEQVEERALQDPITASYTTSGQDLADAIAEFSTTLGVTSVRDLADTVAATTTIFTPTVEDRTVLIRAVQLDMANASQDDVDLLRAAIAATSAEVTLIASTPEQGLALSELTQGTGVIIDSAGPDTLVDTLPAPIANTQLVSINTNDVDAVLSEVVLLAADIEVTRQGSGATVTWSVDGELIAAGQQTTLDPARVGIGTHEMTVTVETDREALSSTVALRVTADGDAIPDDACELFDPFPTDVDGDGTPDLCDSDDDGDGLVDVLDPCPTVRTDNLRDADLDGRPDRCDGDSLDGPRGDIDGDGFPDLIDNCPTTSQDEQFDADSDGIGNACEVNTPTICTILGTSGDDVLIGTEGDDVICGLEGDDRIVGFGGNDVILAGPGNDVVAGSGGNDLILGGSGDDELSGNGDDDDILGEAGNDVLLGGFGADVISGGRGADKANGEAGADIIFGGRGADELLGGDGPDTIDGEGGNDVIFGENGMDVLTGGPGADELGGGRANDRLVEIDPTDFVRGGTGDDLIDASPLRVT